MHSYVFTFNFLPHLLRIILIFDVKLDIFSLWTKNSNWWEKNYFFQILFKISIYEVKLLDSQNMNMSSSAFQKKEEKNGFYWEEVDIALILTPFFSQDFLFCLLFHKNEACFRGLY